MITSENKRRGNQFPTFFLLLVIVIALALGIVEGVAFYFAYLGKDAPAFTHTAALIALWSVVPQGVLYLLRRAAGGTSPGLELATGAVKFIGVAGFQVASGGVILWWLGWI